MVTYGTDIGPACSCGGTIYSYDYDQEDEGTIDVHCVTCRKYSRLRMDTSEPLTSTKIREAHKRSADLIARFEAQTGNTYDPAGPEPEECEDCGRLFQYMVDTRHGPGHSCHTTRCASRAVSREEV